MNTGEVGWSVAAPAQAMFKFREILVGRDMAVGSTFRISDIPQNGADLRVTGQARSDTAANFASGGLQFKFNDDAGSNYAVQRAFHAATSTSSSSNTTQSSAEVMALTAASTVASMPDSFRIEIPNYTSNVFNKLTIGSGFGTENGSTISGLQQNIYSTIWLSTSPITSITVTCGTGNFVAGSVFRFYVIL